MSILQIIKNVLALILKGGDALKEWKEQRQRAKEIQHAIDSANAQRDIDDVLSKHPDRRKTGGGDSGKEKP